MHPKFCIVSDRPEYIRIDENRRPHCADGPSHQWRDGWTVYHWHGYRVPSWFIEQKHLITPAAIVAEKNAELRRVMFEIYTPQRFIAETGAVLLSEDVNLGQPRRLYEAAVGPDRLRVLHVVNHSLEPDGSRREFWLGMPDEVASPHDAVARSFGFNPSYYREACAS
jgi:hypothetical protein